MKEIFYNPLLFCVAYNYEMIMVWILYSFYVSFTITVRYILRLWMGDMSSISGRLLQIYWIGSTGQKEICSSSLQFWV
jgi:hypothetical protein